MPEPTTVWMVQLELSTDDVEGTLALDEVALRFTAGETPTRTIALTDVTKVKRIFGSPVLLVHSNEEGTPRHTAFYFRKPPPLRPPETMDEPPSLIFGKGSRPPSKRKQRRANATYLTTASTSAGEEVRDWWKATRAAVATAKGR